MADQVDLEGDARLAGGLDAHSGGLFVQLPSLVNDLGKLVAQTGVLAHSYHGGQPRILRVTVLTLQREAVHLAFEVQKLAGQRAAEPDTGGAQFRERPLGDACANDIGGTDAPVVWSEAGWVFIAQAASARMRAIAASSMT